MKILLLEDDLILSDILAHHLKESGFRIPVTGYSIVLSGYYPASIN
jgi:DNA-binding response OmpR family regulator